MATFTVPYAPQQAPFAPNFRLVELLRDQGSDAAQFALRHGEIDANLANTLGRIPGQAVQTYQEVQKSQIAQQHIDAVNDATKFNNQADAIIQRLGVKQDNGTTTIDRSLLTQEMVKAGLPLNIQAQTHKTLDEVDASLAKFRQDRVDHQADLAHAALTNPLGMTPTGFALLAGLAKANGSVTGQEVGALGAALAQAPDDEARKGILQGVRNLSEKYQKLSTPVKLGGAPRPGAGAETLVNPSNGEVIASGEPAGPVPPERPTEASLAIASVQDAKHPDGTPLTEAEKSALAMTKLRPFVLGTPGSSEDVVVRALQIAQAKNNGQPLTPEQTQAITLQAREQFTAAGRAEPDAAPSLTPEALDLTAHQFAMTGQLPPMGLGKAGAAVRTQIINKAADVYKGLDLPSQVAAYKANQASLTKLQGTADKVSAFESTAGKNLDQFLALAAKVPDTGIPWVNSPIRTLNANVVGSTNQAAFNAARDVALREIARVTNDPNLSGALTDSARKEVQGLSPESATFAQIKHVATVLKQDMANVKSSMNEQIGSIQQRIATPPGEKPSAFDPTKGGAPNVGDTMQKFGATYKWDGTGWAKQP